MLIASLPRTHHLGIRYSDLISSGFHSLTRGNLHLEAARYIITGIATFGLR